MTNNVFEIWKHLNEKTPFRVRRENWHPENYLIVEKIKIKKMPYGDAWGTYHYRSGDVVTEKISCAGCYQWILIDDSVRSDC